MRFQHSIRDRRALTTARRLVASILFCAMPLSGCSFDTNVERPTDNPDDGVVVRDMTAHVDTGNPADMRVPTDMSIQDVGEPVDVGVDTGLDAGVDMPPDPIRMCGGGLVDTRTSNAHCGECDNACDSFYGTCNRGVCECYAPYDACGPDNTCTLKSADPNNCGTCGNTCGASEVCYDGVCGCYPGFKSCGGKCVDIDSDPLHCGDCDVKCDGNACSGGSCRNSGSCAFGGWECSTTGGNACTQTEWNPQYCGATLLDPCGKACDPGQICGQPGLVFPFKCRDYRPALGCTSCPCADCEGEFCLDVDDPADVVFCIVN